MTEAAYLGLDKLTGQRIYLPLSDLNTHAFICGVTGSGKTVLGKIFLEELGLKGIPSIVFDLKGDLSSMVIPILSASPAEFEGWVEGQDELRKEEIAGQMAADFRERLAQFGLSTSDLAAFREKAKIKLFTPRSKKGIPLSFSPIPQAPQEEELIEELANFASETLISLIYERGAGRAKTEQAYLKALIERLWEEGEDLKDTDGLKRLVHYISRPPLERVGVRTVDEFISKKEREELANRLNSLIVTQASSFEGVRVDDIEAIIDPGPEGATKGVIAIVNLAELSTFAERAGIVSQVAYALYNWMRKQGTSEIPRLAVYIDEIGGGGGKEAFFPSHPFNPVSKSPLQMLLRQGRSFGVSCIFATQNPGDIDYKALSNCQTWIIGRLGTKRDREKVLQGISEAELGEDVKEKIADQITALQPGEFLLKTRRNEVIFFQERWLLSLHKTLSALELEKVGKLQFEEIEREAFVAGAEEALIEEVELPDVLPVIASSCQVHPDVLANRVQGIIDLSHIEEEEDYIEKDPGIFLCQTYLTHDLVNTLDSICHKLRGEEQRGAYVFLGHYGSGKSHALMFFYHLFKHSLETQAWLRETWNWPGKLELRGEPIVVACSLRTESYANIWDKIYEQLGKGREQAFISYPRKRDIAALIGDRPFVLILDEVEGFLREMGDTARREQNLGFLQNITELSRDRNDVFVFISLLGRDEDVAALLNRANPYQKLLHLSEERQRVLHFRLFAGVDEKAKQQVIDSYIRYYQARGILPGQLRTLRDKLEETFPIHPHFLEVFWDKVSSSYAWNQTRGLLYMLGTVLREHRRDRKLLLLSDINLQNDDLAQLERTLVEHAKQDAERLQDTPLAPDLITAILVHSFGEENRRGASHEDLEIDILRPTVNYNTFTTALNRIDEESVYVWSEKGRFQVKRREKIQALINHRARRILEELQEASVERQAEILLPLFQELRKAVRHPYVIIHPFNSVESEDTPDFKLLLAIKPLTDDQIDELIMPLRYQNSVALVNFEESLLENRRLTERAAKIEAAREKAAEAGDEEARVAEQIREKIEQELREEVHLLSGTLIRFIPDQSGKLIKHKSLLPLPEVIDHINRTFDRSRIREEIEKTLEIHEETGLSVSELLHDWSRRRGKPYLTDEVREVVQEALRDLQREEKVEKEQVGGREVIKPRRRIATAPKVVTEKGKKIRTEELYESSDSYAEMVAKIEDKLMLYDEIEEGEMEIELAGENIEEELQRLVAVLQTVSGAALETSRVKIKLTPMETKELRTKILTKLPRGRGRYVIRLRLEKEED